MQVYDEWVPARVQREESKSATRESALGRERVEHESNRDDTDQPTMYKNDEKVNANLIEKNTVILQQKRKVK